MSKDKISDYDATAANNTDVGGIAITGSAPPSNFDDALRELASHLADMNAGTSPIDDTFTLADPADNTKRVRIDAGSVAAGETRVITVPNKDITLDNIDEASVTAALNGATPAAVTGADTDKVLVLDASDGYALKHVLKSEFGASDVVLYSAQTLTDAQKLQVNENIGSIVIGRNSIITNTLVTTTNPIPVDNTTPQITEGAECFSLSYVPKKIGSKLVIKGMLYVDPAISAYGTVALFINGATDAVYSNFGYVPGGESVPLFIPIYHEFTTVSLSSVALSVRGGSHSGTCYLNRTLTHHGGNTSTSHLEVEEVLSV